MSSILRHPTCQGRLRFCFVLRNNVHASKPGLAELQHIFLYTICVLSNTLCDICSQRSGKYIAYPLFSRKVEFRIHFNVILRQILAVNNLFIVVINSGNARRVKIMKSLLHSYNYATAVVVRNRGFLFVVKGLLFRKLESQ